MLLCNVNAVRKEISLRWDIEAWKRISSHAHLKFFLDRVRLSVKFFDNHRNLARISIQNKNLDFVTRLRFSLKDFRLKRSYSWGDLDIGQLVCSVLLAFQSFEKQFFSSDDNERLLTIWLCSCEKNLIKKKMRLIYVWEDNNATK